MTYEQAKTLKKGDPVIFTPMYGDGVAEEVKWICLDFKPLGNVIIGVCMDSHDATRWGYLNQFTLFPNEF